MLKYLFKRADRFLKFGSRSAGGRNFLGRICVEGRGGGNKRLYRLIDFKRRINSFGTVLKIIFDTNRTAFVGLILYENGLMSYIILSSGLILNSVIYSGTMFLQIKSNIKYSLVGSALALGNIGLFNLVNNVELKPFKGAQIVRSAGTSCTLIGKVKSKIILKLNSGWLVHILDKCIGSIGIVSNTNHRFERVDSAGKMRSFGFRPKVRGVAKNPCDHVHGGGNGKKSPFVVPVNFSGKVAKWVHTRNKKIDKRKRRLFKKF
jgi:large subunit ribosomal protein L2